jgi:hypothetical protein
MTRVRFPVVYLVALAFVLPACGGGGSTPAAPAPILPPTPANYSGTYSGAVLFSIPQQAEIRLNGRTTLTQNGNSIGFSDLVLTGEDLIAQYQLGTATLTGNTFTGTSNYNSADCGTVVVTFDGRFAGNLLMNLHYVLTPQKCDKSEGRGELSR